MKVFYGKYLVWIPLVFVCGFFLFRSVYFPVHDFANYYFGGVFLSEVHFSASVYFPYSFNKAISEMGHQGIFASYAPNSPFLAFVFAPFSLLPLSVAKIIFNAGSICLFLLSLKRLVSFYRIDPVFVLLIPVLFLIPLKNDILFGQVYFLLFFLIAESWLAYQQNYFKLSAFLLAFAILLKVFPVLLVLIFVFKKDIRYLFFVVVFLSVLVLLSIIFTGIDIWIFYLSEVLPKASNGEISEAYVTNYQSVFMFFKELLVWNKTENPNAFFNVPILFLALILAFKIILIAIGFYITRKANNSLFVIAYWLLAMVLISPYGSTYTFILLLLPYFSLVRSPLSNPKKAMGCFLLFVVCNIPVSSVTHFPFSYFRLLALLLFFWILISWVLYTIEIRYVFAVTISAFLLMVLFRKNESVNSDYALEKPPILIYDYVMSGNRLTYFYWNENGGNTLEITLDSVISETAEMRQNQVFYHNRQLTSDNSNKIKPVIVGDKTLLYLSDYERGIGFYTLRKMKIN